MAKSNKERQADLAARNRAAGRVQRKVWAHQEDWARITKYVERLNRHRERANQDDGQHIPDHAKKSAL